MSATTSKYDPYAGLLLTILNPTDPGYLGPMGKREIQRHIKDLALSMGETKIPHTHAVIRYIRSELGPDTIVYDPRTQAYVIAEAPELAHWYAERRKRMAISHVRNAKKIIDDIIERFPAYAPQVAAAHGALGGVIMMLDAHVASTPVLDTPDPVTLPTAV